LIALTPYKTNIQRKPKPATVLTPEYSFTLFYQCSIQNQGSVFLTKLHLRFRPAREILFNGTDSLNAADADSEGPVSEINDGSTKGWKNAEPGYSESK
jgi:hypothetical protein